MNTDTWSDEWKRTSPDLAVYLPKEENGFDSVNQHFLVTRTAGGAWLAIWTRGADEGEPNQCVVSSRSTNRGRTWSKPVIVDGSESAANAAVRAPDRRTGTWATAPVDTDQDRRHAGIASWGFPIAAPALGRIYCFYTKNEGVAEYRYDLCGVLRGRWSEDDGVTWSRETVDLPMRRTAIDHPDPAFPINWIVFQIPYLTSRQDVIGPFTRWPSRQVAGPTGAECWFLRFDNILTEPVPARLTTTTLPDGCRGLRVPTYDDPRLSFAEEPALVELADGRLYTVMRTAAGYLAYSVSADAGHHWTTPAPLYRDADGDLMLNPVVPAPLYKLRDGRFLLLFYNNNGDANGGRFPCGYDCWRTNRRPAFCSVGVETGTQHQPLRFGTPKLFADNAGHAIGPGGRTDVATYPSLLEDGGERILFYPDRKHFLLGKYLNDDWLEDCSP